MNAWVLFRGQAARQTLTPKCPKSHWIAIRWRPPMITSHMATVPAVRAPRIAPYSLVPSHVAASGHIPVDHTHQPNLSSLYAHRAHPPLVTLRQLHGGIPVCRGARRSSDGGRGDGSGQHRRRSGQHCSQQVSTSVTAGCWGGTLCENSRAVWSFFVPHDTSLPPDESRKSNVLCCWLCH